MLLRSGFPLRLRTDRLVSPLTELMSVIELDRRSRFRRPVSPLNALTILANLKRYRGLLTGDDIPRTTEIILSFDDDLPEFSRKLKQLSKEWEASGLRELNH